VGAVPVRPTPSKQVNLVVPALVSRARDVCSPRGRGSPGSRWAATYPSIDSPGCAVDMVCVPLLARPHLGYHGHAATSRLNRPVMPPPGDGTRGVRRNRCSRSHLCELARARGDRRGNSRSVTRPASARFRPTEKTSATDSAFPGKFEDRVGNVAGPNNHLDVPAGEVAISPSLVPCVSAGRRVVGAELEIATRGVRPAGDRGQRLRPELARLRAYLRHDPRAQSLVGDLLKQILVTPGREAPARGEQGLKFVGQRGRCRSQQVDPPLPGASGTSPSTSTYAETVPSIAVPMAGSNGQAPLWATSTSGSPASATWVATASACRRQYGAS
jgi:hypothetical protein